MTKKNYSRQNHCNDHLKVLTEEVEIDGGGGVHNPRVSRGSCQGPRVAAAVLLMCSCRVVDGVVEDVVVDEAGG